MMLSSFRITFISLIVGVSLVHQTTWMPQHLAFYFIIIMLQLLPWQLQLPHRLIIRQHFFYNPAAIKHLKGTQTSFGTTIVRPTTKFKSYQTSKTKNNYDVLRYESFINTFCLSLEYKL